MTIQEIAQLKQTNGFIDDVLHQPKSQDARDAWRFLREQVQPSQSNAPCGRCGRDGATYGSPYNALHPGWCIYCVFSGLFYEMPEWNDRAHYTDVTCSVYCWAIED